MVGRIANVEWFMFMLCFVCFWPVDVVIILACHMNVFVFNVCGMTFELSPGVVLCTFTQFFPDNFLQTKITKSSSAPVLILF